MKIEKAKYGGVRILTDILSFVSVGYVFIIFPLVVNYHQIIYGTVGKTQVQLWLMLAGCIPCVFGLPWLIKRYAVLIYQKLPFTKNWQFRAFLALIIPFLILLTIIVRFWR